MYENSHVMEKHAQHPSSVSSVRKALKTVLDPELYVSIIDLGLVYDIAVTDGKAHIKMTLTTIGCPLFQSIEQEIREKVSALPDINEVTVELTFDPPWDPSRMSAFAKAELGMEE